MTQKDRWANREVVARYWKYCDDLRLALPGYELPHTLNIIFQLPMAKSWSKKKRIMFSGRHHQSRPDIDNLCKAFMDIWKLDDKGKKLDDSHVHTLIATKFWTDDPIGYIILVEDIIE